MSKLLANLGGNTGALVAGAGMALAIAFGAYIGFGRDDVVQPVGAPKPVQASVTTAPEAPVTSETTAPTAQSGTQTSQTSPAAPSFDELRREPDGTTIIAGRAEPLSEVAIIVDGEEVASATADSSGGFAAITMLPPKDAAQVVSLSSKSAENTKNITASLDEIILAPTVKTETVAVGDPQQVPPNPQPNTDAMTAKSEDENVEAQAPQVAVLKSDADGVQLLNTAKPLAMTSVALDTIGYSEGGDVQLGGRAQPDTAQVRIYLDNRSVISLPVDGEGRWRGDLPDVDEGVYTLRVDEVSNAGDVSSRVQTPFKRESAKALANAATSDGPVKSVTVQAGATLWAIARERYGDGTFYVQVVEANAASIRDPDLIYPGQVFDLPN